MSLQVYDELCKRQTEDCKPTTRVASWANLGLKILFWNRSYEHCIRIANKTAQANVGGPVNNWRFFWVALPAILLCPIGIWSLLAPLETDVYEAVLAPYPEPSVVLTSRPSTCKSAVKVPSIPDTLVQSFFEANGAASKPIPLGLLSWTYDTIDGAKLAEFTTAGVNPKVLIPAGKTLLYFSRVGYNADHSEALFCGESLSGTLFYLRKHDGNLRVVNAVSTWLS